MPKMSSRTFLSSVVNSTLTISKHINGKCCFWFNIDKYRKYKLDTSEIQNDNNITSYLGKAVNDPSPLSYIGKIINDCLSLCRYKVEKNTITHILYIYIYIHRSVKLTSFPSSKASQTTNATLHWNKILGSLDPNNSTHNMFNDRVSQNQCSRILSTLAVSFTMELVLKNQEFTKLFWDRILILTWCLPPSPCCDHLYTWRIIPTSKLLITMVILSPLTEVIPLPMN